MNERAITYRRLHDIPENWGTAVNVQAMVFGNMGETSATGVAFTRNPSTGERSFTANFWSTRKARTSSPASGRRRTSPRRRGSRRGSDKPSLEAAMPEAFAEFRKHLRHRWRSIIATCRIWNSPSSAANLWMLQTRAGKRTGKAALKIAVDTRQ